MNRNKKYYFLFFVTGIIIIFNSCKTTRQTTIALSEMGKIERINAIQHQVSPFNTLSSSLRFSIKPGLKKNTTSANAQLRIIKDQIIQLSLRLPIPFIVTEVARISITPEQIIILDRTNRRYVSETMQSIKEKTSSGFDFDFYSLQALLSNQLFIAGKTSISTEDYPSFNWSEDKYLVKLNHTDNQGVKYIFTTDYTNRILQTEMYKDKKEGNLNWMYKDFGLASNNRLFPMKMTMELTVPDDLVTLNLSFINVDVDTTFELDTTIPDRFQPIEFEQIMKLIQSF